jgi:hypothetical protein
MKLLAHFVADSANFNTDGTFTVFKGGVSDLHAPGFPALCKVAVITRLEFTVDEAAALHEMQLNIALPGASMIIGSRQPIAVKVTDVARGHLWSNVIAEMTLLVPQPGEVVISGDIDGQALPLLFLTALKVSTV